MEKIMGTENVLALDLLSDVTLLSGIDDSVTTTMNISSGQEGIMGNVMDKVLNVVANNEQRLTSLGSLALRRARGFAPGKEWFQVYLGTAALKYMGNQGNAAYIKAVIENHRKLGNIDTALNGLQGGSHGAVVTKVFTEGKSWQNLPVAFRNDSAIALRRVLQSLGLSLSHQESMAIVEQSIREEGGRVKPKFDDAPSEPEGIPEKLPAEFIKSINEPFTEEPVEPEEAPITQEEFDEGMRQRSKLRFGEEGSDEAE
jgi:hypothetical protein